MTALCFSGKMTQLKPSRAMKTSSSLIALLFITIVTAMAQSDPTALREALQFRVDTAKAVKE